MFRKSRTLTGAWIETARRNPLTDSTTGRTLTGAWIETSEDRDLYHAQGVAPSRVRGLKLENGYVEESQVVSHPHGCVD